ncbi:MAG: caspase family protein, partial [Marinoscillum sp.]
MSESFNNNQNNWLVGDRARTNAQIVNGKFYLESKRAGYNYSRRTEEGYLRSGQDYEITIQIRQVKGTNTRGYGLEWGGNSLDNSFYEFWLRSDGFFSIDRFDDSSRSFHDYVPWTYSAAISTNDFNTLKVSKNGDQMTFSINGVQVHQMNAPPILGSEVGFIAPPLGAIEVEFLNIALLNNPPKPIFQKSTTPNIFVLLVGIADYQSDAIKDLSFTVSDVNNMERFYTNANGGGVPSTNIIKLLDNQATKSNILKSLKSLCTRADNNDMVIFYYSGHGDVLGRESPKPLHLIPHDYSPEIAHSSINHQEIEALFAQCKADKKIWMMDAFHSGGSLPQLKGRIKAHISSLEDKDVAILTSSDIGETS